MGLERNRNGLERTTYVPCFDHVACNFNTNRSHGLERNQDPLPFLPCDSHIGAKKAVFAGE